MALVSILTPVYNGAKHLRECIESVLSQTFSDWEYVIINNCSTDDTLAIAEHYATQDRRIRIVTNARFVGIIENHNIAFGQMSPDSKYCKVVQADDWIYPECIGKFVGIAEKNPTVVLVSAYRVDGEGIGLKGLPPYKSVYSGRDIGRRFLLGEIPETFGSPSSHFFKAELIRSKQPFYNPHNMHADTEACFYALSKGDFGFVHDMLTFTRRPGDSQTGSSGRLRTHYPGVLWILKNQGRHFLSDVEHERLVRKRLSHYYDVLARDLLMLRRGKGYWQYHFAALKKLRFPFNPFKLMSAILLLFTEESRKRRRGFTENG